MNRIIVLLVLSLVAVSGAATFPPMSPSDGSQTQDELVAACKVLHDLSRQTNQTADLAIYKNAFDRISARVTNKQRIRLYSNYFEDLAADNPNMRSIVISMTAAPRVATGTTHTEINELLNALDRGFDIQIIRDDLSRFRNRPVLTERLRQETIVRQASP
jgi:hypothetical protein